MPIAKKTLRDGFTVVANEGTYISKSAVERYGFQDDVEDGPDLSTGAQDKDAAAPKGRAQKGA